LRFFGDWFGRPYDNRHVLTGATAEKDTLVLRFDGGEVLRVWQPRGLEVRPKSRYPHPTLVISRASRVHWESYYYGRPHVPTNLRFIDYVAAEGRVHRTTNWEPQLQGESTEDASKSAVELI
jgi:hypothetical protein